MISAGGAADDTITDLGTLVIVGEPDDVEEMDTMKSELGGRCVSGGGGVEGEKEKLYKSEFQPNTCVPIYIYSKYCIQCSLYKAHFPHEDKLCTLPTYSPFQE